MPTRPQPPMRHDSSYRRIFGDTFMMAEFIRGFVPTEIREGWDLNTLEPMDTQWSARGREQRRADLLWRLRRDGEWVYVYVLLELQSKPDVNMALRMNTYVSLALESILNSPQSKASDPLPFILPIVLYNGPKRWRAATSLAERQSGFSAGMRAYSPSLQFLLVDENLLDPDVLAPLVNVCAVFFRLKRLEDYQALDALIGELDRLLPPERHGPLRRALLDWLYDDYFPAKPGPIPAARKRAESLSEVQAMLTEGPPDWIAFAEKKGRMQGQLEGEIKGRLEGEIKVLKRQLVRRFGPSLPGWVDERLRDASEEDLEQWADAVLAADSIHAVFDATR